MDRKDRTMHLRKLAKDAGSGTNGCPTVYAVDELPEDLVIQGVRADAGIIAELENVLDGETAVIIKREVVNEALRKLLEQGSIS
jgi:hypothetical protein